MQGTRPPNGYFRTVVQFKTNHVDRLAQPTVCIELPLGYESSLRRAFASFKSLVSRPSVNQL
jgi:hypothetical protein